jgi:hypothetical protein
MVAPDDPQAEFLAMLAALRALVAEGRSVAAELDDMEPEGSA